MKLSKTMDYAFATSLTANQYNRGASCFVVKLGYYNENVYIPLFTKGFDEERIKEAFALYDSLECAIEHVYSDAKNPHFRKQLP